LDQKLFSNYACTSDWKLHLNFLWDLQLRGSFPANKILDGYKTHNA